LEANKEKESNDLFTFWMNSWYDYVNACKQYVCRIYPS
jgi:hypothetical protein